MHSAIKADAFLLIYNTQRVRDPVLAHWALNQFFSLVYVSPQLADLANSIILRNSDLNQEDVIQDILLEMLRIIKNQRGTKLRDLKSLIHFASKKFFSRRRP